MKPKCKWRACLRYNLPLVGVWRSLVAHLVWDQGVQGSNPCTPTIKSNKKAHLGELFYLDQSFRLNAMVHQGCEVGCSPVFTNLLKLFLKVAVVKWLAHVAV